MTWGWPYPQFLVTLLTVSDSLLRNEEELRPDEGFALAKTSIGAFGRARRAECRRRKILLA